MLLLGVADTRASLDPVRIQKGLFLLSQEGGLPEDNCYRFRAYDYGPFSSRIYSDLDDLVEEGLVAREPVPGYTWTRYRLTADGMVEAQAIADGLTPEERNAARLLVELKQTVLTQSFNRLLRYVYRRYPDYARNSIFSG